MKTAAASPRTTSTARVREVWDARLRQSEREIVCTIAGIALDHGSADMSAAECSWADLNDLQRRRLLVALRDLVQLGNEAAYALGYSRRNG